MDTTSTDTMQDELRALERRWGFALQSAAFGVWDLDPVAETVHYSPQFKAMLGFPDRDEVDATAVWRSRVHPDDLEPMKSALFAHLSGAAPGYEHEFRLRAADGRWRTVFSRGRVVARDGDGRALRMVGTLTDITERRAAEQGLLEAERREAATRAHLAVLAQVSHELRTPLNAVLGFAQLLEQDIGGANVDAQRRFVAGIEQAGWQLLAMIEQMLALCQRDDPMR